MAKKQKTYYEMYQENKRLRKEHRRIWAFYVCNIILFWLHIVVFNTATIGDYILSKLPHGDIVVSESSTDGLFVWQVMPGNWSDTESTSTLYLDTSKTHFEVLVQGACVDKAQTIINILKRRYTSFDRIRVAISDTHAQAVQLDIDGTIKFLKLNGVNVSTGKSEFTSGFKKIVSTHDFIEAINYYKPSISMGELQKYLDNKYKAER